MKELLEELRATSETGVTPELIDDVITALESAEAREAELLAEVERLNARVIELQGDPRDVIGDTGHPEADRLLGRLSSADPDFEDIHAAAILIRKLVVEHRGPDGFPTWKEAAVDERLRRVAVEKEVERLRGMVPVAKLLAIHEEMLESNPYAYCEIAYTRTTGWMAWICNKPREDDPFRKVLYHGQGLTAGEACAAALLEAEMLPSPPERDQ